MLEYEKQIFLDILQDDGLVIAAKGLGLDRVIVSLLKVYCDPGNLVFVLGAEGKLQDWLVKRLVETGVSPLPRVAVEAGVSDRKDSYLEGGLWFVPSRVLVVDMLKKRLPIGLITGIIVCKAHNILKNHLDAFVLKLYRQDNKTGFIKAFSDEASAFKGGFNKVEQILKTLFIRNLLLWPRYHAVVKSSLKQNQPEVIELHLEMSKKTIQLQNALLDLIKVTVQELKRLNPTLDTEEITVENAISETLHKVLHSQLDPVWHALSERTKALLADLKLFHYLILSLLTHDSVSFYALVHEQQKSDCAYKGSGWHFLPSAEIVFATAKERVFPNHKVDSNQLDPEPHPKWLILSEVLAEILRHFKKSGKQPKKMLEEKKNVDIEEKLEKMFNDPTCSTSGTSKIQPDTELEPADILILTRDERNCFQLQMYLTMGGQELLAYQYRKHFGSKIMPIKVNEKVNKAFESKESDETIQNEKAENADDTEADTYVLSLSATGFSKLECEDKVNVAGFFEDKLSASQKSNFFNDTMVETSNETPPIIVIKSYKKNLLGLSQILEDQKPQWIILYDAEMTLVRQVEVYQRRNPSIPVKVYFLVFGGTVEEQAYLTSLRKEKEAFDFLIEEKARVVIPSDINDYPELCRTQNNQLEQLGTSRKGGLEVQEKSPSKIIVDMREFRSELPALIYSRGIEIEPLTITIGDYILTPDICLERKSVSDLIQSLNSGRLYNQVQAMTRYYSKPMLLIEFDKDKSFDLQDRYYLSTDASSEQVVTKLQLLTLHFPQLKLIWSPSPLASAQLFEELKQGHPEPDSEVALGLGVEQTATNEDKFNPGIQKFLLQLPGVTNKNINSILMKGKSLDHLLSLSEAQIGEMLQNTLEGEILFDSIHKSFQPDESSSKINSNKFRFKPSDRGKRRRFH